MPARLRDLADGYTTAWGSQDAASVASFYSPDGSLSVNDAPPAVGREAIAAVAQGFMTGFPDMTVLMDDLSEQGDHDTAGRSSAPTPGRRELESGFASVVSRSGAWMLTASSRSRSATSTAPSISTRSSTESKPDGSVVA